MKEIQFVAFSEKPSYNSLAMRIQTKLILLFLLVGCGILSAAWITSIRTSETVLEGLLIDRMKSRTNELEVVIREFADDTLDSYDRLRRIAAASKTRLTLIDSSGGVVFDSEVPRGELIRLENHIDRREVADALSKGVGTATRFSSTVGQEMLYFAKRVGSLTFTPSSSASIIRVAIPLTHVLSMKQEFRQHIVIQSIVILFGLLAVSYAAARRFTRPIREMERIANDIRTGIPGRRIPVRSTDELGKLAGMLNSMIDKLDEDIERLKQLESVRSQFLANVSHELRTPIFALQASIETLLSGAIDDPAVNRDFLARALNNSRRLDDLLTDLIEISRIESGDMKMSFRFFSLEDFLHHSVGEFASEAANARITLTIQPVPSDLKVYGDKERLKQVISNLIMNAIKYTDAGGSINVSCEPSEEHVRILVKDSGCGIAEEHRSRIFERFYRVDENRSRDVGGTGLGLAIVKHIVEAHGSKVDLTSVPGKGSTFSFTLKR